MINLPIFPLQIVVLPGTLQSLQIFEPRYLNMVKDCMTHQRGFVISFKSDKSDNINFGIEKRGTLVEIIDFNNLPNGLLGITVKAKEKVDIKSIVQLEDRSYIGEILPQVEPQVDDQSLLARYPDLLDVLTQLKDHPNIKTLPIEIDLTSADSVTYHLGSLIPLSTDEKQLLLNAFDAGQRLKILSKIIQTIRDK
ncbi:LON peptidase substrate-binding domain-containing protein [Pseudomonadota bacterium]|jgi:Lon protease-like protein|nr:LON peptidase substrate-binding domain-containing protein [Pseudomonadota bacterium]|tara:strand:+ start:9672 stop:10256 length:585 start_codon:yes stop_codon:yes gene_type:complete